MGGRWVIDNGAPFPFIVGRGRSGTTLVRAIFDSHSGLAIPNESWFVASMAMNRSRYESAEGFSLDRYLEDLYQRRGFLSWGLDLEETRQYLKNAAPASLADAIRTTYQCYAEAKGKGRYGDKTPIYVMAILPISRLLPEARFVHVVRDGRDSALSYMDVPWGPTTIDEAAFRWQRAVTKAMAAGQVLGPGRYHELRYEDLIADPQPVVRLACEFLELEFEAGMLEYFRRADEVTASMRHPTTRAGLYQPIAGGMRDWRTQMSTEDTARFEAIAGPALKAYGYPPSPHRPSAVTRLRAWLKVIGILVRDRLGRRAGSKETPDDLVSR